VRPAVAWRHLTLIAILKATDDGLFRTAVAGVTPLPPHGRVTPPSPHLPPLPRSRLLDEREAMLESLDDPTLWDADAHEMQAWSQPGVSHESLRRLKRGYWSVQAELDLHGLTRNEAKLELVAFLYDCRRRGVRCTRIIHGKGLGSPDRLPVLKTHVAYWLTCYKEVLAFVQARPCDGGSGALTVLLRG